MHQRRLPGASVFERRWFPDSSGTTENRCCRPENARLQRRRRRRRRRQPRRCGVRHTGWRSRPGIAPKSRSLLECGPVPCAAWCRSRRPSAPVLRRSRVMWPDMCATSRLTDSAVPTILLDAPNGSTGRPTTHELPCRRSVAHCSLCAPPCGSEFSSPVRLPTGAKRVASVRFVRLPAGEHCCSSGGSVNDRS